MPWPRGIAPRAKGARRRWVFPFIDLKAQQRLIYLQLLARLERVLAHGQYILGPEVEELEARLAAYVGVKHAITCSSGTDALLLALMVYGVGPGDAVFVPTFTFGPSWSPPPTRAPRRKQQ
jgi:UDP-2-acetamido-2-deoxy-ribo-hexuluronate aminotransferase